MRHTRLRHGSTPITAGRSAAGRVAAARGRQPAWYWAICLLRGELRALGVVTQACGVAAAISQGGRPEPSSIVARSKAIFGETSRVDGSPRGFALQVIEADQLDETLNKNMTNGNRVVMGAELASTMGAAVGIII